MHPSRGQLESSKSCIASSAPHHLYCNSGVIPEVCRPDNSPLISCYLYSCIIYFPCLPFCWCCCWSTAINDHMRFLIGWESIDISHFYTQFVSLNRGRRNHGWRTCLWHETCFEYLELEKKNCFQRCLF